MRASSLLLPVPLLALVACSPVRVDPRDPPETQVEMSLELLRRAMDANDLPKVASFYSERAVYVEGTLPPKLGRAALEAHLVGVDYRILDAWWRPQATVREGDKVRQTGWMAMRVENTKGERGGARGRFEALWAREADGVWRIQRMELVPDR